MICPRGSQCTETSHEIKTMAKASEWWPEVTKDHLPITINQIKAGNGRIHYEVTDKDDKKVFSKG